jgi:micrococcal nuclease
MLKILICTALVTFTSLATATDPHYRLLAVEDGDTLLVEIDKQPVRVQLAEIDAPEDVANPKLLRDAQRTGSSEGRLLKLGRAATDHLKKMLSNDSSVILEGDLKRKDKYGRVPVTARSTTGDSLNSRMVSEGYAVVLRGYRPGKSRQSELLEAEEAAITERAGLWGSDAVLMQAWSGRGAKK